MFTLFRLLEEDVALDLASRLRSAKWEVGRTRTAKATGTIKKNQEISPAKEGDLFWDDIMGIKDAFMANGSAMSRTLMYKLTVPKFNKYGKGGAYNRHHDASPMGSPDMRTDFACTLFLTPPDDYDGGELNIEQMGGGGAVVTVPKGPPGSCVVYECGNAHWVSPVTRGERISAIMWIRSLVKDPLQRSILTGFSTAMLEWEHGDKTVRPYDEIYTTLTGIQTALARMWIDA